MKVAFVQQPISPMSTKNQKGSIEIWIYEIARQMAKHHEVIVYSKANKSDKAVEISEGVQYKHIKSNPIDELFACNSGSIDRLLRNVFLKSKRPLYISDLYYLSYALLIAKSLKSEQCDVVHLHNFPQMVSIIRFFNPKIKIVLEMHCEWLTQLNRKMIERHLKKADLIIGVSDYITDKIRIRFPEFSHRCKTLINGVDTAVFTNERQLHDSTKEATKQLLFVGRVSPEKGVHVLLDAFRQVLKHYPQAHLTVVGPKASMSADFLARLSDDSFTKQLAQFHTIDYMSYLDSKISNDLSSRITFTGSIPHRLLNEYYRSADIVILPSVCNEPCALPLFETMASGIPVIASRGGGTPEVIINGENGLLVKRNDVSGLAEAILTLISDETLTELMGIAGRKRAVQLFSWEQTVAKLIKLYKNMLLDEN